MFISLRNNVISREESTHAVLLNKKNKIQPARVETSVHLNVHS